MFLGIDGKDWLIATSTIAAACIGYLAIRKNRNKEKTPSQNKGKIINNGDNNQSSIGDGNHFSSSNNQRKHNG